jgi:hypothetical protein
MHSYKLKKMKKENLLLKPTMVYRLWTMDKNFQP